jgi:uncharacterized protein DUF2795
MDGQLTQVVRQVLAGLAYPARKWQIVTQADLYGADTHTRSRLHRLPVREYRSPADISATLERTASSTSVPRRKFVA